MCAVCCHCARRGGQRETAELCVEWLWEDTQEVGCSSCLLGGKLGALMSGASKCPSVLIGQIDRTLAPASELGEGITRREVCQDSDSVQRPEGRGHMSMLAHGQGCPPG